jgi:NitT/TauT family transport system permease protein
LLETEKWRGNGPSSSALAGGRNRSAQPYLNVARKFAPWIAALLLLLIWQIGVVYFEVPSYIAPTPLAVFYTFGESGPVLWQNFVPTALESIGGFLIGNVVAILLAIAFVHNKLVEDAFYPIAVFIKSIPILAIAPILVLLLGTGYSPKVAIAALICFFPTLVNMVRGLKSASQQELELMRMLSASKSEIFWNVRVYRSLPYLFAALKIAASSCVIGAIVGEWIGSNIGLGTLIIDATFNYRSSLLYATIFLSSGLSVAFFVLVGIMERMIITWDAEAAV